MHNSEAELVIAELEWEHLSEILVAPASLQIALRCSLI